MTSEESELIRKLENNLERLFTLYKESLKELSLMKKKCVTLENIVQEQKESVNNLEDRYNLLQLSRVFIDSSDVDQKAKRTIEELIREVDACIALLNR